MDTDLEIARCRDILGGRTGLHSKLTTLVGQYRKQGKIPRRAIEPMFAEWRQLPQAEVNTIPDDNEQHANALLDLYRLVAVIHAVSARMTDLLREHPDDLPVDVVESFRAELAQVPL
jgi:hypothetical protein